jgi:hypothetical protein
MATVDIPTEGKAAVFTINVETGEIIDIQGINGAIRHDNMPLDELTRSYGKTGAGYSTVAWITHTHSSPGCIIIIGRTPVKIC